MTNQPHVDAMLRSWIEHDAATIGVAVLSLDVRSRVLELAGATRQRSRSRWPFQGSPSPRLDARSATSPHGGQPGGRSLSLLGAARFAVAGVIVAVFGGFLLYALPVEQPRVGPPGATAGGPGTFTYAASLAEARRYHTATLLPDGRVLVVGGTGGKGALRASAEIWDPASASLYFSPAGSLAKASYAHTATLLPDGRVLIVGGEVEGDIDGRAEIWDAASETFSPAGSLAQGRACHTATLLPDGRVLFVGGYSYGEAGIRTQAEVWDPATASFSSAGSLAVPRYDHTATLLPDGRVLIVGGWRGAYIDVEGPEVTGSWNPVTATNSSASALAESRAALIASSPPNIRIVDASAEIWDPAATSFSPAGSLAVPRYDHTATLLPDGRVLVVGVFQGREGEVPARTADNATIAELWDPATMKFSAAGSRTRSKTRDAHTATLLPDGRVLIAGGNGDTGVLATAEMWAPGSGSK